MQTHRMLLRVEAYVGAVKALCVSSLDRQVAPLIFTDLTRLTKLRCRPLLVVAQNRAYLWEN